MEYDDAFWRLVDVVNLERHLVDAETVVASAEAAITHAYGQVEAGEAAKVEAESQLEQAKQNLQAAKDKAAEIPPELAAAAAADVDARNATRDAVVKAMAQAATGKAKAGRASVFVQASAGSAAAEGEASGPEES